MRHARLLSVAAALALSACADIPTEPHSRNSTAISSSRLAVGSVQEILVLKAPIDMPEGIAIDRDGNVFFGNRRLDGDVRIPEIMRIASDNTVSLFARLPGVVPDDPLRGLTGLAFDARGELYAALASVDPATRGVWHVRHDGTAERLAGSQGMKTPNALTFDARGTLYVTDSEDGTIWRFPRSATGALWLRHPLLAPSDPPVGANGIAFVPPRTLYVANTAQGLIVRVPIALDGRAGAPSIAASGFELFLIDGLTADAHGDLYAVIVGAVGLGTAPVIHVDPATGVISAAVASAQGFDFPTSLAFGLGPLDHKSVYVVNAALFPYDRPDAAPGVVRVSVGVPGAGVR
jgi:sugar lactone lactonase YvrE